MPKYVNLSINGARIRTAEGTSVLDAALEGGICIPHLCHMRELTAFGGCRLCIVEVIENGRSKVTTSCTLEAEEGLVIQAHSPKILRARKNIAEMLVAEAPNSRAIQDVAVRCGVTDVRYPFRSKTCVLCGRCVRTCGEMWQSDSLGFVGRGGHRHVALPFNSRPDTCKRCYDCINVCPMVMTPCDGPMREGEEHFCGHCESQLSMTQGAMTDTCVQCRLGEGFGCQRLR